ncbi:MAG TPA: choline ABC transporter substrate-binding protein [Arenibaculum sp.]|nr:choline ABC transporter substrate-binding protein [Arenibaculum sp.]
MKGRMTGTKRGLMAGLTALLGAMASSQAVLAADAEECGTVRMSDPGWTDITTTNAVAGVVLDALGYRQQVENISVPITFQALRNSQIDVFLGNWMPAQSSFIEPLLEDQAAEVIRANLENAKFTLAVPTYVAEAGVRDFADLDEFADRFGSEIYGIEPGAPANENIQRMIDAGDFGLGDWSLVESSEQGMLSQVIRKARSEEWIVFLAWEPHPMNETVDITYLSGGDEYFGPNFGGTTVRTLARTGFTSECPNLGRLFGQLTFTVGMENEIMQAIVDDGADPEQAATAYLEANPEVLNDWLAGVRTLDGQEGLQAVRTALEAE